MEAFAEAGGILTIVGRCEADAFCVQHERVSSRVFTFVVSSVYVYRLQSPNP